MATPPENANAGLKTRHVFLDTEVYRRYGHNLNDKVLQRLLHYPGTNRSNLQADCYSGNSMVPEAEQL